jgi:hypothetical protein
MSLFPEPDEPPPQAARLRPRLRALADRGIYFGTSSWKYEGWLGSIYKTDRYLTRGKHSRAKFEENCLAEYAEVFPTVCGDFAFYYPGKEDSHKSLQVFRCTNLRPRLSGDKNSTTECTEIHGKENPDQLFFFRVPPCFPWLNVCDDLSCRGNRCVPVSPPDPCRRLAGDSHSTALEFVSTPKVFDITAQGRGRVGQLCDPFRVKERLATIRFVSPLIRRDGLHES